MRSLVIVPHADAGDRTKWTTDQDLRPLSPLGRDQAASLAAAVGAVDAVVSSPALRCVQTVEPVAKASGVEVELHDSLRELIFVTQLETWQPWPLPDGWRGQLTAGAALGKALRLVRELDERFTGKRVAIGPHGDLGPILALFAAGYSGTPAAVPIARGGAYEITPSADDEPIRVLGARAPVPR